MRSNTLSLATIVALLLGSLFGCTPLLGEHEPPSGQGDAAVPDADAAPSDAAVDPCEDLAPGLRCGEPSARCDGQNLMVCAPDASGCLRMERTTCATPSEACDEVAAACVPCAGPEACSTAPRCDASGIVTCGANALGCYVESLAACPATEYCDPTTIACAPRVVDITAGWDHACALWADGHVECWGENEHGQLGDGSTVNRAAPTRVGGLEGVTQISAGASQTCAVRRDGSVWCWGWNNDGRLGDGTLEERHVPTRVTMLMRAVTAVSSFGGHTCARLASGTAACWGYNRSGQLGSDMFTVFSAVPLDVPDLERVQSIRTGADHTCAIVGTSGVYCWGDNTFSQLGDAWPENRTAPAPVEGTSGASALDVGLAHACAVTDGAVRCWGLNDDGQLGVAAPRRAGWATEPVVTGATAVTAGVFHSCARLTDGTAVCWGENQTGALGDGTVGSRAAARPVVGLSGVTAIAAGRGFSCAIADGGLSIHCWGQNDRGQLGVESPVPFTRPVEVWSATPSSGACSSAADCPAPAEPCAVAVCTAGTCDVAPAPATTECRAAWGGCDAAERCDGTSLACPANAALAAGTACTTGIGCGTGQACDGSSLSCPSEAYCAGNVGITMGGDFRNPHPEIIVPANTPTTLFLVAPHNLLVNGGAETNDFRGWSQSLPNGFRLDGRSLFESRAFIVGHDLTTLEQTVDLVAAGISQEALDARTVRISARHFARGGENPGDIVRLTVTFLGASHEVLGTFDTGVLTATVNVWQLIGTGALDYPVGTRSLRFAVQARDGAGWADYYGTILDGASVVVGSWEMQFSNDGVTWSAWEPFVPTKTWDLEPGTGLRTVSVRFRDADTHELAGSALFQVRAE